MNIELLPAKLESMPVIQNMARFYVYDMSKSCGDKPDWAFPEDGLYECRDLSSYWKDPGSHPFLIRVDGELAGFALVNTKHTPEEVDWNMGEFYIVGKFQGKKIGKQIAFQIFDLFPGTWEVMQMPTNTPAIAFWKRVISEYTNGQFKESKRTFFEPKQYEMNVIKFYRRS